MSDQVSGKRKFEDEEEDDAGAEPNKSSMSVKMTATELRQKLKTSESINSLRQYFSMGLLDDQARNYIREGGSVDELLSVLVKINTKKNRRQAVTVYLAIQNVINLTRREFPEHLDELISSCKLLVAGYLSSMMAVLSPENGSTSRKVVLKLLTALVNINNYLAEQVLSNFDFSFELCHSLAEHSSPNELDTVRTVYIRFLFSFIFDRSPVIIKKLICRKGVLSSIFKGFRYDPRVLLEDVLFSLHNNIILNKELSRNQKMNVFNTNNILYLIDAYSWNPYKMKIANKKYEGISSNKVNAEDLESVRAHVHRLLIDLLTSSKHGIAFFDPKYGTASKNCCNQLLVTVIEKMVQPWEDPLRAELVMEVFLKSPDVYGHVFDNFFQPYINTPTAFVKVVTFIRKVIKRLEVEASNLNERDCVKLAQKLLAPMAVVDAISKEAVLVSGGQTTRLAALKALVVCLKKLAEFKSAVQKAHPQPFDLYPLAMNVYIAKHFCDGSVLFDMLDLILEEMDAKSFCQMATVCLLYKSVCPQLLDSVRYKKKKLEVLNNVVKKLSEHVEGSLSDSVLIKTMQLSLLVSPPEDAASSGSGLCEKVKMLCELMTSVRSEKRLRFGMEVLSELLEGTGLFAGCLHELPLWGPSSILPSAIGAAMTHLPTLYAIINQADNMNSSEASTDASPDLDLDDFIELSVNKMSHRSKLRMKGGYSGLNVSPLLISTLKLISCQESAFKDDETVVDYVRTILVHLLHYQTSVEGYVNLLKMFSTNPMVDGVLQYATSWCDNTVHASPLILDLPPNLCNENIYHQISSCLLLKDYDIDQLLPKLETEKNRQLCLAQILFSLCQLAQLKLATLARVEAASSMVRVLLGCYDKDSALKLIDHPELLNHFHPVRNSKHSNLTRFVIEIVKATAATNSQVEPYTARLVFEIKYVIRKNRELKCDDIKELLMLFKLKKQDIRDLLELCLNCNFSHLVDSKSNDFGSWMKLEIVLLEQANRLKICLESYQMILLCRQLIYLSNNSIDISMFSHIIAKQLKIRPDMCTDNNDLQWTFGELLLTIPGNGWMEWSWMASELNGDNAWQLIANSRTNMESSPEVDRRLLCFALEFTYNPSPPFPPPPSCTALIKSLVSTPTFVSLVVELMLPTPLCTENINCLLPFLSVEKCKEMCKAVREHKQKICVNSVNLKFLEAIYTKCSRLDKLIKLIEFWLLRALRNDDSESLETLIMNLVKSITCNGCGDTSDESNDVDMESASNVRLSLELVELLIEKGLSSSDPLCLFAAQQFIRAYVISQMSTRKIYALATSHFNFLETIVSKTGRIKFELNKLMLELIKMDDSLMHSEDLRIYLSAYNATLSPTDRVILQILHMYEDKEIWMKNEDGVSAERLYLWGETAATQYNVFSKKPPSQKKHQVFVSDIGINPLDLLDINIVHNTISNFPIKRKLRDTKEVSYREENGVDRYDPAFLLSVLGQIVERGGALDRRRVVGSGTLSLVLLSMGCECLRLRGAAYFLLHSVDSLLFETNENLFVVHFMDILRSGLKALCSKPAGDNSATKEEDGDDVNEVGSVAESSGDGPSSSSSSVNFQLSSIVTVFLGRSLLILNDPLNPMYKAIVNFIVAKPVINLKTVPAFFELFHSTHQEQNVHQEWILKVLRDGIKLPADLKLALNSYVFKIILDFHSSTLASNESKIIIEEIVRKCIYEVDTVQKLLVNEYSLLTWISHNINTRSDPRIGALTQNMFTKPGSPNSTTKFGSSYNTLCKHIYNKMQQLSLKPVPA